MALVAPQYALQSGYCMSGMYRGYRGDATSTTGSTATWAASVSAFLGWPLEVIQIGGGINASLQGVQQHIIVSQAMFPYSGGDPQGSTNLAATTNTYQSYWKQTVDSLKAQGLNTAQTTVRVAWEGSGSNRWGGLKNTDPNTGLAVTRTDWVNAFRACVLYMRSVGLSSAVTIEWNVMSGGFTAGADDTGAAGKGLDSLYPGDDVVDIVAWDGYAGNRTGLSNRNNYDVCYSNTGSGQKKDLDVITAYARAKGKLAGMSEMGFISAVPGDTTSGSYTNHPADTDLYFKYFSAYFAANADVWAYASMWNENQPYNAFNGTADISEDDKLVVTGTNPSGQTYPRIYSTSMSGTSYATTSPVHTLSGPSYKTYMKSGTMQTVVAPITPTLGTYQVVKQKPRTVGSFFG